MTTPVGDFFSKINSLKSELCICTPFLSVPFFMLSFYPFTMLHELAQVTTDCVAFVILPFSLPLTSYTIITLFLPRKGNQHRFIRLL